MDGRESCWRESVVRDPKGWRIDRRRSVTRYSCQQAAGIVPTPSRFRFLFYPIHTVRHPRPTNFLARSRSTDARLPRNILHVNAASMFSQRRGLSMALSVPCPLSSPLFLLTRPPTTVVPAAPVHPVPPFSHLQRFIPRSWNTAAVTQSLALIGDNCSIFVERRSWCIDLELRWRRDQGTEGLQSRDRCQRKTGQRDPLFSSYSTTRDQCSAIWILTLSFAPHDL